ncbi:MAG: AMP-binding protein, partial [Rubrivivax sp.]
MDTFARDRLPAPQDLPEFVFDLPELRALPTRLNCATELLDRRAQAGQGNRRCLVGADGRTWTSAELLAQANRIARVLVEDQGLVPGNRVLLRGANSPMLAACFLGVFKAGGIAVGTMPLLRAKELGVILDKAQVSHALCDARLAAELEAAREGRPALRHLMHFNGGAGSALEAAAAAKPDTFDNFDSAADDICLMAFTSGTTGQPKAAMHFHRDVMASALCWPPHVLRATADDVFIGSPPLAFTFGLGGLLVFPMAIGACTVLLEKASPDVLPAAIAQHRASVLFTAPTSYRAMAAQVAQHDLSSLRKCVSAG